MLGLRNALVSSGALVERVSSFSIDFTGTNESMKTGGDSSTKPTSAITVSAWVNMDTAQGGTGWPNPDGDSDHFEVIVGVIAAGGYALGIQYSGTASNPETGIYWNAKVDDNGSGSAGYWSTQYYNPTSGAREANFNNLEDRTADGYLYRDAGINWGGVTSGSAYTLHNIRNLTGWQHIAGTFDGQYAKLWVNGVQKRMGNMGTSGVVIQYPSNSAAEVMVGADLGVSPSGAADYMSGLVDEVAIWDAALDADNIAAIYNNGIAGLDLTSASGNYNTQGDLQAYWKFEEGSGTSVADSSSNSNTGTLVNTPAWSTNTSG